MDIEWFYAEGREQRGPVKLRQLQMALRNAQDPRRVLVWREGMGEWQRAGDLPELAASLPKGKAAMPPPPKPVPAIESAPSSPFGGTANSSSPSFEAPAPFESGSFDRPSPFPTEAPGAPSPTLAASSAATQVPRLFGLVAKLVVAQIGWTFFSGVATAVAPADLSPMVGIASNVIWFAIAIFLVVTTVRLLRAMDMKQAFPIALAIWFPVLNLFLLVVLGVIVNGWCQKRGITFRMFGATR